jgi:hypothetical protein
MVTVSFFSGNIREIEAINIWLKYLLGKIKEKYIKIYKKYIKNKIQ